MITLLEFDPTTFTIISVSDYQGSTLTSSQGLYESETLATFLLGDYYWNGTIPVLKSNFPTTVNKTSIVGDKTDSCIISSIPTGTVINFYLPSQAEPIVATTINDGSLAYKSEVPGSHLLVLTKATYLNKTYTITVT